jgi:hypothetical protein
VIGAMFESLLGVAVRPIWSRQPNGQRTNEFYAFGFESSIPTLALGNNVRCRAVQDGNATNELRHPFIHFAHGFPRDS